MIKGLPYGSVVKNSPANTGDTRDMSLIPGSGRSPEVKATHSSVLPGKFHGQRRLVGYSPWGHRVRQD